MAGGIWGWIALVVGGLLLLRGAGFLLQLRLLLRLRARPASLEETTDVPYHLGPLAAFAESRLTRMGFEPAALFHGHLPEWWDAEQHLFVFGEDDVGRERADAADAPSETVEVDALERWQTFAFVRFGSGLPIVHLDFVTLLDGGSRACSTRQSGDLEVIPSTETLVQSPSYAADWADAREAHRLAVTQLQREGARPVTVTAEQAVERLGALRWGAWQAAIEAGFAEPKGDDGEVALTWRGVQETRKTLAKAILVIRQSTAGTAKDAPPPPPELLATAHGSLQRLYDRPAPRIFVWGVFLLSAVAFAVGALGIWGGSLLPILLATLLIHELGHWAAMRLFGYRNTSIFFIPFFGAAATGTRTDARLWQEIVVLLAGPLPGMLIGAGLLLVPIPQVVELGIFMLVLNGLNLLPLFPLDGGRIVQRLLPGGSVWLDAGIRVVASAAFLVAALAIGDYLLGALALFVAFGVPGGLRISALARQLRKDGADRLEPDPQLAAIHAALLQHPKYGPRPFMVRFGVARQIAERIRRREETLVARLPWMIGYGLFLAAIAASIAVALVASDLLQPEVEMHACDGERAPQSAIPSPWSTPSIVVYGCESPTDAMRTELEAAALTAVCRRAPWEAPLEGAARERSERALRTVNRIEAWVLEQGFSALLGPLDLEPLLEDEPHLDRRIAELYERARGGDEAARSELAHEVGAGPACVDGQARLLGSSGERLFVEHAEEGTAPRVVLDYLCRSGCGSVGVAGH